MSVDDKQMRTKEELEEELAKALNSFVNMSKYPPVEPLIITAMSTCLGVVNVLRWALGEDIDSVMKKAETMLEDYRVKHQRPVAAG